MDLQFKTFPFEVKASGPEGVAFEGLVSVFHNIDSYGEIVDVSAFDADLDAFMQDGFIGGLNHDWQNPIGKPQPGTKVTSTGLHLKANVIDTTHGLDVRKMLAAGVVRKLSIGYRVMGDMVLEDADHVAAYWEQKGYKPSAQDVARAANGARVLTRIQLLEGSPVTVPANDLAMITAVKAAREAAEKAFQDQPNETAIPDNERDFEAFLRDAGWSKKEAVAITNHGFKSVLRDAATDDADPANPDFDALVERETQVFKAGLETVEQLKQGAKSGGEADTPAPDTEDAPADSETLPDGDEADEAEVIVNSPELPANSIDAPLEIPEPKNAAELNEEKTRVARAIAQRQALLDANIELSLSRVAGR